jgi:hypothetical protein
MDADQRETLIFDENNDYNNKYDQDHIMRR